MSLLSKIILILKETGRGLTKLRFFQFKDLVRIFRRFTVNEKWAFLILFSIFILDIFGMGTHYYFKNTSVVPSFGSTYTEGLVGEPRFINPLLAQSQTDKDLVNLVYAGMYKFNDKAEMVPDLADGSLKISPDGKQYTVKLKQNLKWHDGQPLNADDVIFTLAMLQNPDFRSPLRGQWSGITATKVDDVTLTFTNKNISAPFISNFTVGILPKHIWSNIDSNNFSNTKYNLEPVGSGPFFIKEINKAVFGKINSISLDSYSNYWDGKPYIDTISFRFYENYQDALFALQTKQVEGMGFIPFDTKIFVDAKNKLKVTKTPLFEYQALFFNLTKTSKTLGDRNVRQALAQAIDRKDLISVVDSGLATPAYGPIMPGQIGYSDVVEKNNPYDLNASNSLLDKAGWSIDPKTGFRTKGGVQLQFTITTNDFVLNTKTIDYLRDQWKKIGVNVISNVVSGAEIGNYIRPRNFDALLFTESTGVDPDPFIFWHSSQSQNPGFNIAQYKNTNVDRLISDARNTFNPKIRSDKYSQFQSLISTDLPAIFLTQSNFVYEVNPKINGAEFGLLANPEDRFYNVNKWFIQTKRKFK